MDEAMIQHIAHLNVGMKVFYEFHSYRHSDGRRTRLTPLFPNSMLISGMNIMADRSDWFNFAVVGTAGTPIPSPGDTGLYGYVAGIGTIVSGSDTSGAQGSAPFYGWRRKTWRFDEGTTATPLAECGVGWSVNNSDQVSRGLIVDSGGTPTVITPLIDESLEMTAEIRIYPPLGDVVGQVVFDGDTFDTTTRASEVTSGIWGQYVGDAMSVLADSNSRWQVYTGLIGTIEQAPSGVLTQSDNFGHVNAPYSNNSFEIDMIASIGPTGWNSGGSGFRSMRISTKYGLYQTEFQAVGDGVLSPGDPVPKDSNFTMQMGYTMGWTEQVIP